MHSHTSFNPLKSSLPLLIGGMILLFSCTSQDSTDAEGETLLPDAESVEVENPEEAPKTLYMLPSALQIAHIYKKSGLKYYPDIAHDAQIVSNYVSETSKLQNLGVYTADLCWVALNKQTQEELTYLKTIMELSGDLGFGTVFSSGAFVDRFETNVANEDSMIVILSELQEKLDFYLQEAEMDDMSTIIFSGAWIESMYISLSAYNIEGKESTLTMRIYEQVNILEGLIGKLEAVYEPDQEVKTLISDLNALHFLINSFGMMKNVDKKKHVKVKDAALTDLELDQLTEKVEAIRARITNG